MSLGVIDIIVLAGAAAMTLGIVAMMRSASGYVQIHAVNLVAMAAMTAILGAAIATGDGPLITKALLVGGFLLLTTPLSSHALCRLQSAQGRPTARNSGSKLGREPQEDETCGSQTNRARPG